MNKMIQLSYTTPSTTLYRIRPYTTSTIYNPGVIPRHYPGPKKLSDEKLVELKNPNKHF